MKTWKRHSPEMRESGRIVFTLTLGDFRGKMNQSRISPDAEPRSAYRFCRPQSCTVVAGSRLGVHYIAKEVQACIASPQWPWEF
jgi:hypothetical protein